MERECKILQSRLAIDGPSAIRDDDPAQRHVVDCSECFGFLERLSMIEDGLRELPALDVSDAVVEGLLAHQALSEGPVEAGSSTRWTRLVARVHDQVRPRVLVWSGLAAAGLAAVLFVVGQRQDAGPLWAEPEIVARRMAADKQPWPVEQGASEPPTSGQSRVIASPTVPVPVAVPDLQEPHGGLSRDEIARLQSLGYIADYEVDESNVLESAVDSLSGTTKFTDDYVQDLPVPGRFYQNVLTLAPGLRDSDGDDNLNVHGARVREWKSVAGNEQPEDAGKLDGPEEGREPDAKTKPKKDERNKQREDNRPLIEHPGVAGGFVTFDFRTNRDPADLDALTFQEASGYWRNTYVPGDTRLRLLHTRLTGLDRSIILQAGGAGPRLHDASRRTLQPFDAPRHSALEVVLQADRSAVTEPHRMLLQVGIRATGRHGGVRPATTLALVLDLQGEIPATTAAGFRALVDALEGAKRTGDSIRIIVAGRPGATVVEPEEFRHGFLRVTLQRLLGEEEPHHGPTLDLPAALATAIEDVAAADDPDAPQGSSAVLLVTSRPIDAPDQDKISYLAHRGAIAGIPVSVVGVGGDVRLPQIDRITLAGQGNRRLLTTPSEAAALVERELAAISRAVARAVRLRIRLAPDVRLVGILGSERLDGEHAQRVREAEQSIDLRLARNLGIEADRGEDEDGIQLVIPSFYAGDSHVMLLDVVVPGPGPVADVVARYKDLVYLRNGVSRGSLDLERGEGEPGPLQRNVIKNRMAMRTSELLEHAGLALRQGAAESAGQLLDALRGELAALRGVPGFENDAEISLDIAMIDEYRALINGGTATAAAREYVGDSMRYASRLKVLPRPYVD